MPVLKISDRLLQRAFFVGVICIAVAGVVLQVLATKSTAIANDRLNRMVLQDIRHDYNQLSPQIITFADNQAKSGIQVVDNQTIQDLITPIYFYGERDDPADARKALTHLQAEFANWQKTYDAEVKKRAIAAATPLAPVPTTSPGLTVPILIYHQTPGDFAQQLQYLQAHGYNTITLNQLSNVIRTGAGLPAKPVIITFDDGFSNQLNAFHILQQFNMKATYYIINGGSASNWCIGANRNNYSCGDAYMNWDEIRMLDRSGLITIAAHTINHLNLASLPADQQRHEIVDGKAELEQQLGHQVLDFAYPYGSYNATTIQIVKDAGFESAVSTVPGTIQSASNLYSLYRIRDPYKLP